jgi:hypothetical protein
MTARGHVRQVLRLEGLAYFVFALFVYVTLRGSWVMFLVLFMVPDVAFAAYLAGPRIGAVTYNILHSTTGPLMLAISGYVLRVPELHLIAAIWLAHVGFDRMLGYGLKYASGFKDTHLGKM